MHCVSVGTVTFAFGLFDLTDKTQISIATVSIPFTLVAMSLIALNLDFEQFKFTKDDFALNQW